MGFDALSLMYEAGFEVHPNDDTKMRCTLCFTFSPHSKASHYQKRGDSIALRHCSTETHVQNLAKQVEQLEKEAKQQQSYAGSSQLSKGMDMLEEPPIPSFVSSSENYISNVVPELVLNGLQSPVPFDPAREKEDIQFQFEQIILKEILSGSGEESEDASETNIIEILHNLGFEDNELEGDDNLFNPAASSEPVGAYAPYPSKLMMLLDVMDNLPRLRLSTTHFKLIIWLLKEAGVLNVPSYYAFRQMQSELQKAIGCEPKPFTSMLGNHFHVNDLKAAVQRNFSNPHIAPHLNFYPEETDGPISEVWQCERWKEYSPSQHTSMYSSRGKQFYIDEVAQLHDNHFVLPISWIKQGGIICADAHTVTQGIDGNWVKASDVNSIPAAHFKFNYLDIITLRNGLPMTWNDPHAIPVMPHPSRKLVPDGYDLYDVFYPLWVDDVSGNRSKQYNKHINMYTVNSNLPGRLIQQEYFVQFISTSPNATSPEQFAAVKEIINETHVKPILCYNAYTKQMCGVRVHVPGLPGDNPQQAEEASHSGGNSNLLCHKCDAGGTHEVTESNSGYHSLYTTGAARSAAQTRDRIVQQLKAATLGVKSTVIDLQRSTGTKDKVAQYWIDILLEKSQKMKHENPNRTAEEISIELETWLKNQPGDKINPILDIANLDLTQDTPIEILHTILLGVIKYVWYMFHTSLNDQQKAFFVVRLQSTDLDGLTVPPLRAAYMMQYRNNLIGKHFKTLMQTMAFHVQDMVTPVQFDLIKAVGELGAMLWVHEIDNMEQYLGDLDIIIGNTLDAFAAVDPAKIIKKVKLHLLPHIIPDICRFGPIIRNSTEGLCSVYSNGQAPSRDIAQKFSGMDRMKHILSGGFWYSNTVGEWIQATTRVQNILHSHPIIQRHLGWVSPQAVRQGAMKPMAQAKTKPITWFSTKASSIRDEDWIFWNHNFSVIAQTGDSCRIGSWVTAKEADNGYIIGRIVELLSPAPKPQLVPPANHVTIERFIIGAAQHHSLGMPVLYRSQSEVLSKYVVVAPSDILFRLSVQHDCRGAQSSLNTKNDDWYLINTHALHNAHLIRKLLPRELTAPQTLHNDREAYHYEIAEKLRVSQTSKRDTGCQQKKREEHNAQMAGNHTQNAGELVESDEDDDDSDENGDDGGEEPESGFHNKRKRR
ncbi:uncharacterized protein C8R40DRAFT_1272362 [Lentinula edodes]|uniref:uncharacterized protein n=1 Tax=Lentinula edodes TaxID=5353 RepID=UPI001E8ECCCC|nr:uncharacterized protein C8R40DRAFT_1272362 [Lentinula edodes]KAH7875341.1 hypothetical protein C8R40DRAFT_1272362 [Lentinula edodes]